MSTEVLSRYRLVRKLGSGGMGVVYEAEDLRLGRSVALKFLPEELTNDPHALERFRREARAASALDHPHICAVHDIDVDDEGRAFIVMEKLEGGTLAEKCASKPLPVGDVVALGIQMADGLAAAHAKGVLHRDLKPGNIFVNSNGQAKLLDFGLAKIKSPVADSAMTASLAESLTAAGEPVGTLMYMSPEQVLGKAVDARSDIFSFGAVLYEMSTGTHAFSGTTIGAVSDAILHQTPTPPSQLNTAIPHELEHIINKALQKERGRRYQSANELRADLEKLKPEDGRSSQPLALAQLLRRRGVVVALLLIVIAAAAAVAWLVRHNARVQWARSVAIPQATELMEQGHYMEAYRIALEAERYAANDAVLQKLWPEISRTLTIHSQPEGAEVYIREYNSTPDAWRHAGRTPITGLRVPLAFFRWRFVKPGYVTREIATSGKFGRTLMFPEKAGGFNLPLQPEGSVPNGMVFVRGGDIILGIPGLDQLPSIRLTDYYLDKYEVTNRQYKQFVDAGGYGNQKYWKQPFVSNGRAIGREEAMAQFRDKTGRAGPATWILGDYPEGQADYPVSGVSWYEAAAYAEFVGKSLPTVYHWDHAAGTWAFSYIAPLSNIGGEGPLKVGSKSGMTPFGAYDMAGNVKEWCWNEKQGKRYILGGAWNEPTYLFVEADVQDPFRRAATYGFRLAKYETQPSAPSMNALYGAHRDYAAEKPVSDQVFRIYKSLYAYDKKPLEATLEEQDEGSDVYRKQRVTLTAGYGNERLTAYVLLPKHGRPPYQTVIYFPGSDAIYQRFDDLQSWRFRFLVKSGRAVVYPIYKGTYSRGDELEADLPSTTSMWRDHVIYWSKDLGRALDYIESRSDLDRDHVAYVGFSWGAVMGAILPAVEPRIKAAVLVSGGLQLSKTYPEVDAINFAPRVKQPTLMLNGRYDGGVPVDSLQEPLFRLLGAAPKDKRHVVFDCGHVLPNELFMKETLDWLDRYLGPVK